MILRTLFLAAHLALQEPTIPPAPLGLVSDFADVLSPADEARMTALIEIVRAGSRGEIAIVTLRDLGGRDVGDVALTIGRTWGVGARAEIGDAARNAGVVVLLVPKETSADGRGWISIQVGQGAEGFIPDAVAGDIRREATPLLGAGQYGSALALITARLAERYSREFGFALDSTLVPPRRERESRGIPPIVLIFMIFMIASFVSAARRRAGRGSAIFVPFPIHGGRDHWSGGGFGGGFGGGGGGFGGFGGGGGFSGGGSSGSF